VSYLSRQKAKAPSKYAWVQHRSIDHCADDCGSQRSFSDSTLESIKMDNIPSLAEASFCESVEAGHTSKPLNARIAELLGITKPPVQMDSQAKYCSIARGDGHLYLRLPVQAGYEEKIWVSLHLNGHRFSANLTLPRTTHLELSWSRKLAVLSVI
jgi:hypothetical protein